MTKRLLESDVMAPERTRELTEDLKRKLAAQVAGGEAQASVDSNAELELHLKELVKSAQGLLDNAESKLVKHPVAAAAAALILGFLIGRVLR
jgi:hypothetical protein